MSVRAIETRAAGRLDDHTSRKACGVLRKASRNSLTWFTRRANRDLDAVLCMLLFDDVKILLQ